MPHAPQLLGSLAELISHPSLSLLLLQSLKPIMHVPLQVEPAQVRVAMPWNEQLNAAPQPPQSLGLLVVLISHPLMRLLLSQSAKPLLHVPVQLPPVQAAV